MNERGPATADDRIEVEIEISASVETVWRFLSEPERFAAWIGAFAGQAPLPGTDVDPRVGGALRVAYPGDNAAMGEILEMDDRRRICFSWGYVDAAQGVAPGSTRVEIVLSPIPSGTRVVLTHTGLPTAVHRDGHRGGWTHYLSMLAKNAAHAQHGEAARHVLTRYFASWSEVDAGKRAALLEETCDEAVVSRSGFACTNSRAALDAHIRNAQQHMPGVGLQLTSDVQQLHGYATVRWAARTAEGQDLFTGAAFAQLTLAGKLQEIVTFAD